MPQFGKAPVVQWIEYRIPVPTIGVRLPTGVLLPSHFKHPPPLNSYLCILLSKNRLKPAFGKATSGYGRHFVGLWRARQVLVLMYPHSCALWAFFWILSVSILRQIARCLSLLPCVWNLRLFKIAKEVIKLALR